MYIMKSVCSAKNYFGNCPTKNADYFGFCYTPTNPESYVPNNSGSSANGDFNSKFNIKDYTRKSWLARLTILHKVGNNSWDEAYNS